MDPYALGCFRWTARQVSPRRLRHRRIPNRHSDGSGLPSAVRTAGVDYTLNRVRAPGMSSRWKPGNRSVAFGTSRHSLAIEVHSGRVTSQHRGKLSGHLQGLLKRRRTVTKLGSTCRIQFSTTFAPARGGVSVWSVLGGRLCSQAGEVGNQMMRVARRRYRHDAYVIASSSAASSLPARSQTGEVPRAGGGGRPMRFVDSIEPAGRAERCASRWRRLTRSTSQRIPADAQTR